VNHFYFIALGMKGWSRISWSFGHFIHISHKNTPSPY